ncbi:MAG TPA: hypothetical protein VGG74_37295 [Kofleriaceae bacterium]
MRVLLLVIAFAGCATTTRGPAWPKSSASGEDGGESLAPRPSAHELSEPEHHDEATATPEPTVETPAAKPEAPAATTPVTAPSADEPATTEEITIEIDDD